MGKKDKKLKMKQTYEYENGNFGQNQFQNPYMNGKKSNSFLDGFNNADFVKGLAIGAIGAYLLTNKNAQESIFKLFNKGSEFLNAGVEELKERYEDMKAQMQSQEQ